MPVFSYTHNSCPCAKPQASQSVQTHHQSSSVTHWEGPTAATPEGLKPWASTWSHTHVPVPPKGLCSATHCHQHLGLQIQRHSNHLLHVCPSSPKVWEGNKHNNMKNTYNFTFLQSDGKHSEWSLCAAWLDLDPPPTTTHSISEVGLDTQKSFCFKRKPPGKSSHRPRNLKHSRHFTSNRGNWVKQTKSCHTCSKGKEEALVSVLP